VTTETQVVGSRWIGGLSIFDGVLANMHRIDRNFRMSYSDIEGQLEGFVDICSNGPDYAWVQLVSWKSCRGRFEQIASRP
jgi:hypothetical protein